MQQQAPQNVAQQRPWHELALVVLPAAGVALVAFWLAFQFVEPAPPRRIVMSTGGTPHQLASDFRCCQRGVEHGAGAQHGAGDVEEPVRN